MKFYKSKFAVYCALVFLWLACCATSCDDDFGESKYFAHFCAQQPSGVDSLELRVTYQAGDSVWMDSNSTVEKYDSFDHRDMVCVDCRWTCDSLFALGRENKITVNLSFYCADKEVSVPAYLVDNSTHHWGEDDINYRFVEFDERKISGEYVVVDFLPPDDTSCGKFVNYAVLRLP